MRIKYILLALMPLTGLNSCVEETEINTDNFVINSMFSSESPFIIQTSKTASVFDTATYHNVKNVEGRLYEDDQLLGELIFQEAKHTDRYYLDTPAGYTLQGFNPKGGKNYKVEFTHGDRTITASDVMPSKVDFTITDTITITNNSWGKGIRCNITFSDPKTEDNYYVIYKTVSSYGQESDYHFMPSGIWMQSSDPSIEYLYGHISITSNDWSLILSDKYFNGMKYTISLDFPDFHEHYCPDYLQIHLLSVSEQYYNYVISCIEQRKNNFENFHAEPTPVYNNIDNGYGIFAAYSESKQVLDFRKKK